MFFKCHFDRGLWQWIMNNGLRIAAVRIPTCRRPCDAAHRRLGLCFSRATLGCGLRQWIMNNVQRIATGRNPPSIVHHSHSFHVFDGLWKVGGGLCITTMHSSLSTANCRYPRLSLAREKHSPGQFLGTLQLQCPRSWNARKHMRMQCFCVPRHSVKTVGSVCGAVPF